jgi:hypothetical protein
MLVLLTPTGGRPEGLALLAGYLNTQTWQGAARWLVVDDCDPATPAPLVRAGIEVEVMRPAWRWQPGMNTQATCMAAGLSCIEPGDTCIVLEDDDAYLPGHVAGVLAALERAELAGERVARYYNVATGRCREIPGQFHASLASTAVRARALALLREVCAAGSRRIDMDLWRAFTGRKVLLDSQNVVGIKGMPGRGGIGVGHRDTFGDPDPSGQVLAEWLGAGAETYRRYRRAGG